MSQPHLFPDDRYRPPVRRTDPASSHRAAGAVEAKLGSAAAKMLASISDANAHGVFPTANEAAAHCARVHGGMAETFRKRAGELLRAGRVTIHGERKCKLTGQSAQTYQVATNSDQQRGN